MATNPDKTKLLISGYCRLESNDMNIVDGIIFIIFEYQKHAKWSNKYKGDRIILSEDDSKATAGAFIENSGDYGHSNRADFCIEPGQSISWELECMIQVTPCNFFGVVSSQVTNFNENPSESMKYAYGLDDGENSAYYGQTWSRYTQWQKPRFPKKEPFTIRIIADWRDSEQCKLTFFYNEKKLNDSNDNYTMLVQGLDPSAVLYPCVTPYNQDAYCTIRYV